MKNFSLNRREFLALTSTSAVAGRVIPAKAKSAPAKSAAEAAAETRWHRQAEHQRDLAEGITWMTHEPLYFIRRRGGDHFLDEDEIYARMHEPEKMRQMAAARTCWPLLAPQSASNCNARVASEGAPCYRVRLK